MNNALSDHVGRASLLLSLSIAPLAFLLDPVLAVPTVWLTIIVSGCSFVGTKLPSPWTRVSVPLAIAAAFLLSHYTMLDGWITPRLASLRPLILMLAPPMSVFLVLASAGWIRRRSRVYLDKHRLPSSSPVR